LIGNEVRDIMAPVGGGEPRPVAVRFLPRAGGPLPAEGSQWPADLFLDLVEIRFAGEPLASDDRSS
jgi:hypothetical protein